MVWVTVVVRRVSTEVGARARIGATADMKSRAGSSRTASTRSRIRAMRSVGSSTATGAAMRAPLNRLPPRGWSASRRLTGKAMVTSSRTTPWAAWYRRRPPTSAARNASLSDPPAALPAARRSARGTDRTANRRERPRCTINGEGGAGGLPATRAREPVHRTADETVGTGRATSLAAKPAAAVAARRPPMIEAPIRRRAEPGSPSAALLGSAPTGLSGVGAEVSLWRRSNSWMVAWPSVRQWCSLSR